MISRRTALAGLAGLTVPAVTGCAARQAPPLAAPTETTTWTETTTTAQTTASPAVAGLDAVIDISHNVTVSDFALIRRRSNILGIVHKASEGGDWVDPSYRQRRPQAEAAGLLWGAYHFGTHQYSGAQQAAAFLAAAQPTPATLMALDFEPNNANWRNTMNLAQAEAFVQAVYRATRRLPLVYTHPSWANGERSGRADVKLRDAVNSSSILARCDLWLADYREQPEVPFAWTERGWRLWQYSGDESESDAAFGTVSRAVAGVSHCDRNLFAGDAAALSRFWNGHSGTA